MNARHLTAILCSAILLGMANAATLEEEFRNPPHSPGIRAFWWWLNSNVTKEASTRDLEEMKAKGFSGALIFDADGSDQRGNRRVPAGPVFGSSEWTNLFVHACQEAKRLDVELRSALGHPVINQSLPERTVVGRNGLRTDEG